MNSVALITGASRGIGRGIALALAETGFDLVLNYARNEAAARQTAQDCQAAAQAAGRSVRFELCRADVGAAADRLRLIEAAQSAFGRLDVLVNNAGITSIGRADVLEATEENFDRLMAVNMKGPFFLTQLAARWMIEQSRAAADATSGYRPRIVTISSVSADTVSTNRADYCMAKASLGMMTRIYAARLAAFGILVYEVRPGIIASDMTAGVKDKYDRLIAEGLMPIPRWGTPEDVGRAIAALVSDSFQYSTGETINVDGGFHIRRL
jgi:NAD(P)-dependent dehydrogenase (short-subunit alcohol dehydrogenase family)